ncbi:MAG: aminotransferase class III-fold pyridoxal phosphate-dependent enzyme [Alphaproteobacteria bacterium]|nr:aminotransferase class III-fold pyridoxal phosphate-dependent enzyme [Alphaproteobacteria bacterium]
MLETALRRIPIGSQTFSKSHMQVPAPEAPQFVTHGRGGRIWDVDGNEYVDMMMSLLPVLLGYADAEVDAAIVEQLDKGIIFSMPSPLEAEVAELIAETIPSAEQVRFGKNGSDATAGAVRLARAITGRDHVIACGYHGWQDWYIGGTTRNAGVPQAVRDLIRMVPYNDLAALEQALETNRDQVAAVIMEPMNVAWPRDGYLAGVRDLAHRHGALLIFDEIITGFRFAAGGAQELFGVTPDLTALGKGMANGMPLSAVVGPADLMKTAEEIFFSFTAGGEALSLAAAKATIAKVRAADVPTDLDRKGQILTEAVEAEIAANDLTGTIGLAGHPCWKILTVQDHEKARKEAIKTLLIKEMMVRGILVNASHNLCFAHDRADLERVTAAYRDVLPIVADELSTGRLEERLSCPVIEPVFRVR